MAFHFHERSRVYVVELVHNSPGIADDVRFITSTRQAAEAALSEFHQRYPLRCDLCTDNAGGHSHECRPCVTQMRLGDLKEFGFLPHPNRDFNTWFDAAWTNEAFRRSEEPPTGSGDEDMESESASSNSSGS